jgi:hypothetical protein
MSFALNSLESAAPISDDETVHAPRVVPGYAAVDISAPDFHNLAIWRTGDRCFVIATNAGHFSRSQCGDGGSGVLEELRDDGATGIGVHEIDVGLDVTKAVQLDTHVRALEPVEARNDVSVAAAALQFLWLHLDSPSVVRRAHESTRTAKAVELTDASMTTTMGLAA